MAQNYDTNRLWIGEELKKYLKNYIASSGHYAQ